MPRKCIYRGKQQYDSNLLIYNSIVKFLVPIGSLHVPWIDPEETSKLCRQLFHPYPTSSYSPREEWYVASQKLTI